MSVRQGYYADWQGLEYEASPDGPRVRLYTGAPTGGFTEAAPGRFVRTVPAEELDRLHYVATTCRWQGEPFLVIGEHEEWLRVEYTGRRPETAERLGLEHFDRGVYQAWVRRAEVGELEEKRF